MGKTSLLHALTKNESAPSTQSTDGIDLKMWVHQGLTFNLWDFAGQSIYPKFLYKLKMEFYKNLDTITPTSSFYPPEQSM